MQGAGWYRRTTDRFELPRIPVDEWPARRAKPQIIQPAERKPHGQIIIADNP